MLLQVIIEMALGGEGLRAGMIRAVVGSLTCVHSEVSFEVSFLVEGAAALLVGAFESLIAEVRLFVNFKALNATG